MNEMNEQGADRVAYLVAGYIRQTLSEKEHDELDEWITANDDNQRLFEELTDPITIQGGLREFDVPNEDLALHRIKSKIRFTDKEVKKKRRSWISYSAAASIIIAAGLIIFFMANKKTKSSTGNIVKTNVIKPGGNFATLTLADGKAIDLSAMKKKIWCAMIRLVSKVC